MDNRVDLVLPEKIRKRRTDIELDKMKILRTSCRWPDIDADDGSNLRTRAQCADKLLSDVS
jgi:hypothetical protein